MRTLRLLAVEGIAKTPLTRVKDVLVAALPPEVAVIVVQEPA